MPDQPPHQPAVPTSAAAPPSSVIAEISREIVKAHAQYYGRGPTKARTVWREDVVVVILEEIFTRAERTLVDADHFEQVRATRQAFQDQVGPLFCQIIEQATGRRVRSFLSQVSTDSVAAEVFVLVREDAPSREDGSLL
ncbi:MAG: Na-translocating system protein MpsC family protein [Solirubrobacterales bacterium]